MKTPNLASILEIVTVLFASYMIALVVLVVLFK